MANNYAQFSVGMMLDGDEQKKWWKDTLDNCRKALEYDEEDSPLDPYIQEVLLSADSLGFEYAIYPHDPDNNVVFYSEECGHMEVLIPLVQAFLLKFYPLDGCWSAQGAYTCDKPRVDEFGGFAVFVTATSSDYMGTGDWVADKTRRFHAANRCIDCPRCTRDASEISCPRCEAAHGVKIEEVVLCPLLNKD